MTFVLILPTNRRLLQACGQASAADAEAVRTLLARWGRLHWLRTLAGVAGFVVLAQQAL